MFKQIVLGLLVAALGGGIIYFSGKIVELFGRNAWADEHLGGTKQAVVLIGLLLFVVGGMMMFGFVSVSDPMDGFSVGNE